MSGLAVPIYISMYIYIPAISDKNYKQTVARIEQRGAKGENEYLSLIQISDPTRPHYNS